MSCVFFAKGDFLVSYEDLQKTDFYSFFNFSESGRKPMSGGLQEIYLKPGGFPEFIDLRMMVDQSQTLHEGVLYLDRDWIGGPMTVSPFGRDLAKSFIAAVTPAVDREKADSVVSTIWNIHSSSGKVNLLQYESLKDLNSESPFEKLENVYFGVEDKFEMTLKESCIKIENVVDVGRKRLKISVEPIE